MKELKIKKMLHLKQLATAVAMTACLVSHAFAAMPKTESTITHGQITLGDVFDGVTENTDYYLAPAPAPGKTVVLNARDLTRISEAFSLGWVPDGNFRPTVIRRTVNQVDRYDIQSALQNKMAGLAKGQKFEMELSDRSTAFSIPENTSKVLDVDSLTYDLAKGEFTAAVAVAALPEMKKELRGRLYQVVRVPVLKNSAQLGDVISAADIDYVDMRANTVSANIVLDANKIVGLTPRHAIASLKPMTAGDMQLPLIVKKGDLVTMVLKNNIMSLTAQGRALDNGAEGDAIRVMNTSSKQVLGAVVTGSQTVSVKSPSNTLAMN